MLPPGRARGPGCLPAPLRAAPSRTCVLAIAEPLQSEVHRDLHLLVYADIPQTPAASAAARRGGNARARRAPAMLSRRDVPGPRHGSATERGLATRGE